MTSTEWIVLLAGLAAIAWVNWYFFVAGREPSQLRRRLNDQRLSDEDG
jgi:hypothetical protein